MNPPPLPALELVTRGWQYVLVLAHPSDHQQRHRRLVLLVLL
jgi:hypothetical protein